MHNSIRDEKKIPKLAATKITTTKKHPFTYLWRDKKNLHTNEEKKKNPKLI
jgi:hypothetical protein